ncbi:HET-domain-containing protein, partial [Lophium mytilinum]
MRLLNVDTLELKTFYNRKKRPPYAILSHTWDDNEISFEDMKSLHTVRGLAGFSKVEGCCRIARERGHQWVWIVTLCIDKSSSSELSEAINSMFRWYKEAKECYAYLVDVDWFRPNNVFSAFSRSRWFTRGWTLQELIAPEFLLFYSQDWKLISERHAIAADLAYITSIHKKFLSRHTLHDLGEASTAEKMSWASGRETEREEDMSYCLMGLFGVNMPLLYGEGGERAFLRLQEEILKRSEDHTIFCW